MDRTTAHRRFEQAMEGEAAAFERGLHSAPDVQERILKSILVRNQGTEFGLRHGFKRIETVREFQGAVPLASYEDLLPDISAICAGRTNVLTAEPVLRLHLSSGTSSALKYLPFTGSLAREFQAAISPWLCSMYRNHSEIRSGPAFWALTPPLASPSPPVSELPVGFDSEEGYFDAEARAFLPEILCAGGATAGANPDRFFYQTLLELALERELSWFSVWSPTYLLVLWEKLQFFADELLAELRSRSDPEGMDGARRIEQALCSNRLEPLWPNLKLLSCWSDGWAASFLGDVRRLFPSVPIERKGLMATEGVVSIPWGEPGGEAAPILAYRSHFFEFIDCDSAAVLSPHELTIGREYEIVLTTGGGLYRYRLGDIVRCEGFEGPVPRLSFQGRAGAVSDMCGEKLNEYHVQRTVDHLLSELGVGAQFRMLVPEKEARRYRLLIEPSGERQAEQINNRRNELLSRLDGALKENVHYAFCRKGGQLNAPLLQIAGAGFRERFIAMKSGGIRLGVLKTGSFEPYEHLKPLCS